VRSRPARTRRRRRSRSPRWTYVPRRFRMMVGYTGYGDTKRIAAARSREASNAYATTSLCGYLRCQ
jgi:hypothetical protein